MPDTVAEFLRAAPTDRMRSNIERLATLDRYQASEGIGEAASMVADWARKARLSDISIEQYAANGAPQWWTFDSPVSWSPRRATVSLEGADGDRRTLIDHGREPFSIATYSAATPDGGDEYPLKLWNAQEELAGCVVIVPGPMEAGIVERLQAARAAGFISDSPTRLDSDLQARAGRIELPAGSGLFAFSVTPRHIEELKRAADSSRSIHVDISTSSGAPMPVATASIPGRHSGEIWILSHLCHPRPGANDNCSGVAASLGLAAALMAAREGGWELGHSIRFLWGPEFVGTVASLSRLDAPRAVINLDMVGEDQGLCSSPFVIERSPQDIGGAMNPLAERVVAEVFRQTGGKGGSWRASPFLGYSDHGLFADSSIGRPAIQFCHPADRFNHSGADTLDKVSVVELARTVAAAAGLLFQVDQPLDPSSRAFIAQWCRRWKEQARRDSGRLEDSQWHDSLLRHVDLECDRLHAQEDPLVVPGTASGESDPDAPNREWDGPINVRAMLKALTPSTFRRIQNWIQSDKANYSLLLNFGIRIDGRRSRTRIADETGFSAGRRIDADDSKRIWNAFEESGFIS